MLLHAVQAFQERADVALVVCVLPRSHAGDPPPWLFQCDLDRLLVSSGGKDRGESVWNGLEDLPDEVADRRHPRRRASARDRRHHRRVIAEARAGHGAVAALPVVDTLKEVDDDGTHRANDRPRAPLARANAAGVSARVIERAYRRRSRERGVAPPTTPHCASGSASMSSWCAAANAR